MYKIGEFSKLAKTTVKTLRFYEQEDLLVPDDIDSNGYRLYSSDNLLKYAKIANLRQMGFSIEEIKRVFSGENIKTLLILKKKEIEKNLTDYKLQLSKIDYFLEEQDMKYQPVIKELPACIIYCKEGILKDFGEASAFITSSAEECLKTNPNIKCVEPDYCFVNYLDDEFKDHDIGYRYCQAVTTMGIDNETIKFKKLDAVKAVCIYHKSQYELLGEAYGFVMKYIEENGYKIIDKPRECYIDGIWNKENPKDWLTEIQVPVEA